MKKRFFKLFFIIGIMACFTFTLASCKKEEKPVEPTPEPQPEPTPEPVTLKELPDGYYVDLFQVPNSIVVNFKGMEFTKKEDDANAKYTIDDSSVIRIGIVNDTLKANGFLKLIKNLPYGSYVSEVYFSLDNTYIVKKFTYPEPNFDYKLPEDATKDELFSLKDAGFVDVAYYDIELSKEFAIEAFNEKLADLGFDVDLANVKSLEDLITLFGLPKEKAKSMVEEAESLYKTFMSLFFDESFKQNEITLKLSFDTLNLINDMGRNLTIASLVDSVFGEGTFDKLLLLFEEYSKVDKALIETPSNNVQYYTLVDGEYVPCESLTQFDENTDYYIDNKDIGEYTIGDLLITSASDETGFVKVEDAGQIMEKLFGILQMGAPLIDGYQKEFITNLKMLHVFIILSQAFGIEEYYLLEPVTGLTEWALDDETEYYLPIYKECENLTSFDKWSVYFTKNEKDEYILVDKANGATPEPGRTYYKFDIELVSKEKLKTPDQNTNYYKAVLKDEYVSTSIAFWNSDTKFYTLSYEKCQNLTSWESDVDYYYFDYKLGVYLLVDQEEIPSPYADTTYYVERYTEVDKNIVTEPAEDVNYYEYISIPDIYEGYSLATFTFDKDESYFEKVEDEYVLTNDTTPVQGKTYYVILPKCEFVLYENLTEFNPKQDYYIYNAEKNEYESFDIWEEAAPDSTKTYYKYISRFEQFLSIESLQSLTFDEMISGLYPYGVLLDIIKRDPNIDMLNPNIKLVSILAPIVDQYKDAKIYEFIAKVYDKMKPDYVITTDTEWDDNKEYYIYDEDDEEYILVDKDEVTAPIDDVTYYVTKATTAKELAEKFDDIISKLKENVKLEIVTDNDAKLQKIVLDVKYDPVFGNINIDFTKAYNDPYRSTLLTNARYASEYDGESTAVLEKYLTDDIFEGYDENGTTFELVKQNGKYIGFKEINEFYERIYLFGENEEDGDDYFSRKDYYALDVVEFRVGVYDYENKFFTTFDWRYDLKTKKFFYDHDMDIDDEYYFDYTKNEYVSVYVEVDRTETEAPAPRKSYFTYDEELDKYTYKPGLTNFEEGVKYYTLVEPTGDVDHPFVVKTIQRYQQCVYYVMIYFSKVDYPVVE